MKIIPILIAATLFGSSYSWAQPQLFPTKPWIATLKITDESGEPVAGANVEADYRIMPTSLGETPESGEPSGKIDGLTDTNGLFTATHTDRSPSLGFYVQKMGYYKSFVGLNIGFPESNANNRNTSLTLILRKIVNPISMYAKQAHIMLQDEGKPMGYDLMIGDWVTPYGKGFHTDIVFTLFHRQIISQTQYNCELSISFPNAGDGITVTPSEVDTGSGFKTARMATVSGYEPELDLQYSNTNQPPSVFGYFIRVRTELNPDGSVRRALYGKIDGNFKFYAGTIKPNSGMGFTYYLNPTPNDQNLEFNPSKNLIKDLKFDEQVKAP
jgi:hypothetical protein